MSSGMARTGWVSLSWIATRSGRALGGALGPRENVLERRTHAEVLLLEPKLAPHDRRIVGVQNSREIFRVVLVPDGLLVVALVEVAQIELAVRLGGPQANAVDRGRSIPGHQHVVGHGHDVDGVGPVTAQRAGLIPVLDEAAAKANRVHRIVPRVLPRVTPAQPDLRLLDLPPVLDALPEHPVDVADSVAAGGVAEGRQTFHEARRQSSEPAVAQGGFGLVLEKLVQLDTEFLQGLSANLLHAQVDQIGLQRPAWQEFHREVVDDLGVLLRGPAHRFEPVFRHVPTHEPRECSKPVDLGRVLRSLGEETDHHVGQLLLDSIRIAFYKGVVPGFSRSAGGAAPAHAAGSWRRLEEAGLTRWAWDRPAAPRPSLRCGLRAAFRYSCEAITRVLSAGGARFSSRLSRVPAFLRSDARRSCVFAAIPRGWAPGWRVARCPDPGAFRPASRGRTRAAVGKGLLASPRKEAKRPASR